MAEYEVTFAVAETTATVEADSPQQAIELAERHVLRETIKMDGCKPYPVRVDGDGVSSENDGAAGLAREISSLRERLLRFEAERDSAAEATEERDEARRIAVQLGAVAHFADETLRAINLVEVDLVSDLRDQLPLAEPIPQDWQLTVARWQRDLTP